MESAMADIKEKECEAPVLQDHPPTEKQSMPRWRTILSIALRVFLLTCCLAALHSHFIRKPVPAEKVAAPPNPFCLRREWHNKQDFAVVSAENGITVQHRPVGMHRYVDRRGHVEVMETLGDRVFVVVNVRATTEELTRDTSIHVQDKNHIVITNDESTAESHECVSINVMVVIPSSMPSLNLSFVYSDIHIASGISANIESLHISTQAGSINSESPMIYTNHTAVHTLAGSIKGSFILGDSLSLVTSAGSIDVEISPDLKVKSPKATLETTTNAGSLKISLLAPLIHRNQLSATHLCTLGTTNLRYPIDWEGVVHGQTSAGLISMTGEGLEIVDSGGHLGERTMKAVKGKDPEEKSHVEILNTIGSIRFQLQ